MIDNMWIIFGGIVLSLGFLWIAAGGTESRGQTRLRNRAMRLVSDTDRPREQNSNTIKRRTPAGSSLFEGLAKRLVPRPEIMKKRLEKTGKGISIGAYCSAIAGIVVLVSGGLHFGLGVSIIIAILAGVALGVLAPHTVVGYLGRRRIGRFEALFPDAIDLMVRGLRSGLPVSETIAAVGTEMSDPVGAEFRLVADAVRLGQDQDAALWDAARRLDTAEFKFFVISLAIQKETGGNLSETLANLSDILRRRRQMRLKVRAMSSEARASAYILGSLPFLMFGIIYMLNPDYESQLFTDPRGKMMLLAAGGLMTTGIAVMAKMVRFEI